MSLNSTHPSTNESQYNTHNLYGHLQGKVTSEILKETLTDKRPFVLSRSTFAGSGSSVQHWLGNTMRTWEDMKNSIAGVMNFNMFGIPMVGPDTCGTFGDFDNELCGRWF